ncbi:OmpA family protein [Hyphomonas sp.]|uniref:OmpA family protein n=1 Tax=Hyphomonas sp. TaxID=87 RepID=UPI0032EF2E54
MHKLGVMIVAGLAAYSCLVAPALAEDIDGVQEHPMVERYPGQDIRWQHIENHLPYRVPVGPVTGYRAIDDWIDTEGRITRTFYRYQGTDRAFSEIYLNYLEALEAADFEILGKGYSGDRKGVGIGSGQWIDVVYRVNAASKPGEVGTMFSGTSSSGGAGSIVAKKERVDGTAYIVITVEQHSANYVGSLIDIIETKPAETGLVIVNADAMGADIDEYGRVVLDGILFDFDKATLKPESKPALDAIAEFLAAHPDKQFYVVGHTDAVGTFTYNHRLSADRATAVREALVAGYEVSPSRLEAHGVGPLVPVFSNQTDTGKHKNRRVELVERQPAP